MLGKLGYGLVVGSGTKDLQIFELEEHWGCDGGRSYREDNRNTSSNRSTAIKSGTLANPELLGT